MSERRALTIAAALFLLLDMTPLRFARVWRRSPIRKGALEARHSRANPTRRN